MPRVPFDQASENHFQQLAALKLRVGSQDLKIAAVALANNLTLLTCNRRDFGRIPGLALDGPIVRITTPHIPLPAADHLEDLALPSAARIVEKIARVMNG